MEPFARPPQMDPALVGGSPLWFTGEDQLRLTVFNAVVGAVVTVRGRFLPAGGGHVQVFEKPLTPATTRSASTLDVNLGEGWLLDAQAIATTGAPLIGQTFALLSIVRGLTVFIDVATLAADYLTAVQRVAYPGGDIRRSLDGEGAILQTTGADPAAGVECSDAVPTGVRWELLAWTATFVTDATVATRQVELVLDDGANVFQRHLAGDIQTASQTHVYSFGVGNARASAAVGVTITAPLVRNFLKPAYRIRTITTGIVAGDNWGSPQFLYREWIEGAS